MTARLTSLLQLPLLRAPKHCSKGLAHTARVADSRFGFPSRHASPVVLQTRLLVQQGPLSEADTATQRAAEQDEQHEQRGLDSVADAAGGEPGGARVYRRTRAEHHRIFRWGIGNKFRMQSKNRLTPVHRPHPKEVVVRDEYYESDNPNIMWEDLNEAWEVYWYENMKLNAKPFPVKKFGVERAKREAWAFLEELEASGKLHQNAVPERSEDAQEGVFYDMRLQSWVCFFWRDGRPQARSYSATKYGYEGAKSLAQAKRRDPVNGVLPVLGGGGTPRHLKQTGRGL